MTTREVCETLADELESLDWQPSANYAEVARVRMVATKLRARRARLERLEAFVEAAMVHAAYRSLGADPVYCCNTEERMVEHYRALISQPESGATEEEKG